jgi:hypothetical protein
MDAEDATCSKYIAFQIVQVVERQELKAPEVPHRPKWVSAHLRSSDQWERSNQSRGLQGTDRVQAFAREVGVQSGTRTGDAKLVSLAVFGRHGT